MSRVAPIVTAGLLAVTLATTAARPLYHADLWAHLAYGRHVLATGAVPETEPLMPLAAGVRFVNFAWLSGASGSLLFDAAGPEGLRLAGGLLVAATVGLVGTAARRRCGTGWGGWSAGGLFLTLAWFQLFAYPPWVDPLGPQMLRPQTAGVCCFAALLAATPAPVRPGWRWVVFPVGFALWTNLHGSWPVGLLWLTAGVADRAVPLGFAAWRSRRVRRSLGLLIACAAACCVNPLGPRAFLDAATFGRRPNLADVIEWQPLTVEMTQGCVFFVAVAALAVLAARGSRRIRVGEAAVLIGFGLATCMTSRWLLWWAGPAAVFGVRQVASLAGRRGISLIPTLPPPGTPGTSGTEGTRSVAPRNELIWTLGLGLGIALSVPTWRLAAGERAGAGCLAAGTPVRAAAHLRRRPPAGLIFNAHGFGDFLLFAGPPGVGIFVGSHAHLIPPRVWEDARAISIAADGWEAALDRYGVATLALSPATQPRLIAAANASDRWEPVYRDRTAVLFERSEPARSDRRADP